MRSANLGAPARARIIVCVGVIVLVAVLAVISIVLPVYWVYLVSTVAISALIARGIGVVTNRAGLITLCQLSFAAIGGWVVSWLALEAPGIPFPILVLIGGIAAAPAGLVLGLATARIRGVELAVVTLGFAAALDLVLRQGAFPGVGAGTPVIPAAPFDDPRWFFALAWALLLVLQLGVAALGRTAHGLGWAAMRSSERAAAALGVRVARAKAEAFGVGALFAGVAGGLLAGQYGLLTPDVFTPLASMVHLATAVLCGAGLFAGALLAGVFAVFVPELLRRIGLPLDVAQALLAIGAFDVLRRGNGGIAEQLQSRLQDRAFRGVRATCELTSSPVGAAPPERAASGGVASGGEPIIDPTDAAPRLEITGLTVALGGDRVLDAVGLAVAGAEVHALIGPNGAGKSTLVDAATGFLPGYEGSIRLDGDSVDALPARDRARHGLRRTFQHQRAIETITVDEYLRLAAGPAGSAGGARQLRQTDAVREFLGLPEGRLPIRLMDAGSRRILEIAGALVSRPRMLLLDEPAAGLGDAESLALAERVRRLPAEFGCAVLLIEHDMAFVRVASARATVLDEGRVIGSGPTAEMLEDPRVIAAYLGREAADR